MNTLAALGLPCQQVRTLLPRHVYITHDAAGRHTKMHSVNYRVRHWHGTVRGKRRRKIYDREEGGGVKRDDVVTPQVSKVLWWGKKRGTRQGGGGERGQGVRPEADILEEFEVEAARATNVQTWLHGLMN